MTHGTCWVCGSHGVDRIEYLDSMGTQGFACAGCVESETLPEGMSKAVIVAAGALLTGLVVVGVLFLVRSLH